MHSPSGVHLQVKCHPRVGVPSLGYQIASQPHEILRPFSVLVRLPWPALYTLSLVWASGLLEIRSWPSGDTELQRHHIVGGWWCIAAIGPCNVRTCANMSTSHMSSSNTSCSNMPWLFEGRDAGRKIAEPQHENRRTPTPENLK